MRPDSYSEWLTNLNEGDEAVVQYIWVPGKPTYRAWVLSKSCRHLTLHWMTFDDPEHGIAKTKAQFSMPGGGNTHIRINHPERAVEYHPQLGYEFTDRIDFFLAEKMLGNAL